MLPAGDQDELIEIINKIIIVASSWLFILLYQWCTVAQTSKVNTSLSLGLSILLEHVPEQKRWSFTLRDVNDLRNDPAFLHSPSSKMNNAKTEYLPPK